MLEYAFPLASAKANALSPVGRPTVFVQISMLLKSGWRSVCTNSIRSWVGPFTGAKTATAHPTDEVGLWCALALGSDQGVIGLVELSGIEPLTPCVQGRCSPS